MPFSKLVRSKVSRNVGKKIRAKTKGKIKTASPAKISSRIKVYREKVCCLIILKIFKEQFKLLLL